MVMGSGGGLIRERLAAHLAVQVASVSKYGWGRSRSPVANSMDSGMRAALRGTPKDTTVLCVNSGRPVRRDGGSRGRV